MVCSLYCALEERDGSINAESERMREKENLVNFLVAICSGIEINVSDLMEINKLYNFRTKLMCSQVVDPG